MIHDAPATEKEADEATAPEPLTAPVPTSVESARSDESGRHGWRPWQPVLAVSVVYALLAMTANAGAWAHGVTHTIQTAGGNDVGEEVWFLAQTPWALIHGHNPFVNNWLNAPVGLNLMDNTTMPLLGLAFAPLTLLFGPIATFNVVLDAAIWASAMAAFLMIRRFVRWWPAAFVGGLVYGFTSFAAAMGNGHLFLLFQAAAPLIVLFVHRFLSSEAVSPWWTGLWVGGCYVVQFYVSTEVFAGLVVMTLLAAVVALAFVLWTRTTVDWRRMGRMGACAAVVVVIGTGYGAWMALEGPVHVSGPVQSATAVAGMSTDPLSLVVPSLNQHFTFGEASLGDTLVAARDAHWHIVFDSPVENGTYIGFPLLLTLAAGAIALRRRRIVQFSTVMALAALLLSMGTDLHIDGHRTGIPLPFFVFAHLPLFSSSVAARWISYFWVFATLVLALVIDAVHERVSAHDRGPLHLGALAVCVVLCVVALLPLVPAWPYSSTEAGVPAWFTSAARTLPLGTTAVVYPPSNPTSSAAMVWQAEANMRFKMPGGYAIFTTPAGTASFYPAETLLTTALDKCVAGGAPALPPATVHAQLRAVHAHLVVIVPWTPGAACAERIFHGALGSPRQTKGVLLWRF